MTQGAYSVKVGGDFTELTNAFKQAETQAKASGQAIGKGLGDGIDQAAKSFDQLQKDLADLKAQKVTLSVDSREYAEVETQIAEISKQIGDLARTKTKLPVDSSQVVEANTQFRLLDGIIEGVAFSLTNTLTNAAGSALQALGNIPRTVSEFSTAQAVISTLGVDTAALSQNFVGLTRELNNNVSQVELMQAAYDVASSGFADAASNTEVMRAAALLATGGFTDLQTAGDGLTSVLNAYGMSAAEAEKVTDMIIQTQNDGKIVAGEYAAQIGRIAPTAVASGVGLDELNAAIAAATAQGVPVESTFSGLQQAIVSILKPSQDASKFAKELGIEWSAAALQGMGLGDFLQQLVDKGADSSEAIIRLTGSTEAQSALLPLLNDGLERYNTNLDNQKNSAGVAADATDKASVTMSASITRLGNVLSDFAVQTFSGLEPIVAGAINAVTGFINVLNEIPAPIDIAITAVVGLTTALVAAAVAYSAFNSTLVQGQIAAISAAITSLAASISGLLGAVVPATSALGSMLVAIAPLAVAVGAVVAAFALWNEVLGGAREATEGFSTAQEEAKEALNTLNAELGNFEAPAVKAKTGLQGFVAEIENLIRYTKEDFSLLRVQQEFEVLQGTFTKTQTSAIAFLNELSKTGQVTAESKEQAVQFITALEKLGEIADSEAPRLRELAAAAADAGNPALAANYLQRAEAIESEGRATENLITAIRTKTGVTEADTEAANRGLDVKKADEEATKKLEAAVKARAEAEAELNQIIAEAPIRDLEAQVAVGEQLVGLAKALAEQEQSRFDAIRSGIEYELSKAEERGASEKEIGDLKKAIDQLDREAAEARFAALTEQQQLETAMLALAQEKARIESDLSIQQARVDLLKAESELRKATTTEEKAAANAQIDLQRQILGIREEEKTLLGTIQPLQTAILTIQQEAAINAERSKAAQEGYKIAADGSLQSLKRITDEVVVSSERQADGTVVLKQRYQEVEQAVNRVTGAADNTTLAISRAADGSIVLTQRQTEVAGASSAADKAISSMADRLGLSATNAGATAKEAEGIGKSLGDAADPASGIADAFVSTSGTAPAAAQGALDFAAYLDKARNQGQQIADLPLVDQMANVASSTQAAANAAASFYDWLERASRLPGSRWSGGPVEAGEAYKVNELGQEALLSHGRLSLINAPANSTWRAPADGTVIPAGITARLQEQGMLPGGGGAMAITTGTMSNAALAIEVGKLRQEIGELTRKSWNVNVAMKTGPTGSQVMRQMLR
jgi:TP901 family phage tail tape measure protein